LFETVAERELFKVVLVHLRRRHLALSSGPTALINTGPRPRGRRWEVGETTTLAGGSLMARDAGDCLARV